MCRLYLPSRLSPVGKDTVAPPPTMKTPQQQFFSTSEVSGKSAHVGIRTSGKAIAVEAADS
jgi:hypothetical protein